MCISLSYACVIPLKIDAWNKEALYKIVKTEKCVILFNYSYLLPPAYQANKPNPMMMTVKVVSSHGLMPFGWDAHKNKYIVSGILSNKCFLDVIIPISP